MAGSPTTGDRAEVLQDTLEAIDTKTIVMEISRHKTPAVTYPAAEENYTYVLMAMHIDGK